jgi:phospho-N-acetylmuramoyl-pentapeptide-transferase
MIFALLNFLKDYGVKVPIVFSYYSTRMMLAAVTALIVCIFLGPRFIKKLYEWKIGQTIRTEDCPLLGLLHEKKKDTPTMGGGLILLSMLFSMFLWMDLTHIFTLMLFITTLTLGFLGARDDYLKLKYKITKGLSGRKKLMLQVAFSTFIACYLFIPSFSQSFQIGSWFAPPIVKEIVHTKDATTQFTLPISEYAARLYIPFFKEPLWAVTGAFTFLSGLLAIFVITGSSNAVNLTDGLDGLAAGCLVMVASSLALIAFVSNNIDIAGYLNILYIEGSGEIAIYLAAFAGACLGFLWYNGYPAQVFMGDTGSLSLGGILGVSAVLLKRELLLGLIGGIFVVETLSVIIQVLSFKYRNKKRVFLCTPIHHHFEYKGWPETKVVIRFWIIGLLLAIIGIASLKFQ